MDEKLEVIKKICTERDQSDEKFSALKEIYMYNKNKNVDNIPENTLKEQMLDKVKNNIEIEVDEE